MSARPYHSPEKGSRESAPRRYRLAAVSSHPVQYQAPLFRRLAGDPSIDLTVYYGRDDHFAKAVFDKGFGIPVAWDRPLLDGYTAIFLSEGANAGKSGPVGYLNLVRDLYRQRYDAVLVSGYATLLSVVAYFGAWLSATPILLRTESELLRKRKLWVRFVKRIGLFVLFRRTSAFLSIGKANRQFFRHYGAADRVIFDTPYCVDNDFFVNARHRLFAQRQELKKAVGLSEDLPVVVFCGKFIDRKRPLDLIVAFARLQSDGINANLLLIGEGPLRPDIQRLITSYRLKNVVLVGFKNQTELAECYACGDVFVLPSEFDTWGLVVNEAMLFGMPVIATDMVGSAQDLIEDEVTGFVYPVGSIDRLTYFIKELLLDSVKREAMGLEAERRVSRLSYDACKLGVASALAAVGRGAA
jgi:glycosyltransferase involved in cell wall biosynthesis